MGSNRETSAVLINWLCWKPAGFGVWEEIVLVQCGKWMEFSSYLVSFPYPFPSFPLIFIHFWPSPIFMSYFSQISFLFLLHFSALILFQPEVFLFLHLFLPTSNLWSPTPIFQLHIPFLTPFPAFLASASPVLSYNMWLWKLGLIAVPVYEEKCQIDCLLAVSGRKAAQIQIFL